MCSQNAIDAILKLAEKTEDKDALISFSDNIKDISIQEMKYHNEFYNACQKNQIN